MSATKISPAEAFAKMSEGFTYVDVRTEAEFAAGHPEGAIHVAVMLQGDDGMVPNDAFVAAVESAFSKGAPLIVGCKMGGRSARAAALLTAAGFTNVLDQRAGYDGVRGPFGELTEPGWSRCGLPIAR